LQAYPNNTLNKQKLEKCQEMKQGTKEGNRNKQTCQADKKTNQNLKKLN
jgi:hypothetical protein